MDTSDKPSDPADISSTSTCFHGISDVDSEELKRRRNLISQKASSLIAINYALRQEIPSEANINHRGDADQSVEVLTRELTQWQ